MFTTFPLCNFGLEFPELLSQNHIYGHWLSINGNSKMMRCGILSNILLFWHVLRWCDMTRVLFLLVSTPQNKMRLIFSVYMHTDRYSLPLHECGIYTTQDFIHTCLWWMRSVNLWWCFCYNNRLIVKGFKQPLQESDLFELNDVDKAGAWVPNFERNWTGE